MNTPRWLLDPAGSLIAAISKHLYRYGSAHTLYRHADLSDQVGRHVFIISTTFRARRNRLTGAVSVAYFGLWTSGMRTFYYVEDPSE